MLITIDGPAGSGKSTVARRLAKELSEKTSKPFEYLDTGSMYRSVALLGMRENIDWNVPEQLEELAAAAQIDVDIGRTFLNGEDVTDRVRLPEITEKTKFAADNPVIRQIMVESQRRIAFRYLAENKGVVTEGRDQGSAVFPDADCKFFVTATPEERAKRRCHEFQQREIQCDFQTVLQDIIQRDQRDSSRQVGPLKEPQDALRVVTDKMSIDDVVEFLVRNVLKKIEKLKNSSEI